MRGVSEVFKQSLPLSFRLIETKRSKEADRKSGLFVPNVVILSKHSDGSLNEWEVSFDANSRYASLQTVSHLCRVSGHRFQMVDLKNHPSLPLILTVSHHNVPKMMVTDSYGGKKSTEKPKKASKVLVSQMSV